MEVWKPIPDYEGIYEASSLGRIRSLTRRVKRRDGFSRAVQGTILSPTFNELTRNQIVCLKKNGNATSMTVSKAVTSAFHGAGYKGQHCVHLDGVKMNNRPENLAWKIKGQPTPTLAAKKVATVVARPALLVHPAQPTGLRRLLGSLKFW